MRIPVLFGNVTPRPDDAWLVEDEADMPANGYAVRFSLPVQSLGHAPGCVCCSLRGPAADALGRMFRARSTGSAPFFKRLIIRASQAGEAMVREALEQDVVTKARYVAG